MVHFFPDKRWRPFYSSPPKDGPKLLIQAPNLPDTAKCPKINSCFLWGCTWCAGGALTNFPCELRLKFFSPPWVRCRCTHCTPWLRLSIGSSLVDTNRHHVTQVSQQKYHLPCCTVRSSHYSTNRHKYRPTWTEKWPRNLLLCSKPPGGVIPYSGVKTSRIFRNIFSPSPYVGPGTPLSPLSIYFLIFPLFTVTSLSFPLLIFFFCPPLPFLQE